MAADTKKSSDPTPDETADVLRFYREAGVDTPLEPQPVNHLKARRAGKAAAQPAAPTPPAPDPRPASSVPSAPPAPTTTTGGNRQVPDEAQVARAREEAKAAQSLDDLRARLEAFDGCNLKFTAKNLVFADGSPEGGLMLVGEAPGRDEDIAGLPFVGRSGQLLDRMLAAIELERAQVYIANTVPWRPPGNRTPTELETEICRPFIERQIELAAPKVLVSLGAPSARTLLGIKEGILRARGKWRRHVTASGTEIPGMPTLHPAYLLRNPAHKKLAWRDFLEIKVRLANPDSPSASTP